MDENEAELRERFKKTHRLVDFSDIFDFATFTP